MRLGEWVLMLATFAIVVSVFLYRAQPPKKTTPKPTPTQHKQPREVRCVPYSRIQGTVACGDSLYHVQHGGLAYMGRVPRGATVWVPSAAP